jgi:hypothetical protein
VGKEGLEEMSFTGTELDVNEKTLVEVGTGIVAVCEVIVLIHINNTIQEDNNNWQSKVTTILKFVHECTSILTTQVNMLKLALPLFLLTAQISSEYSSGFKNLIHDFTSTSFWCMES